MKKTLCGIALLLLLLFFAFSASAESQSDLVWITPNTENFAYESENGTAVYDGDSFTLTLTNIQYDAT